MTGISGHPAEGWKNDHVARLPAVEDEASATRLCTVCARGGSTGVPGKNLRLLDGAPLVSHSVSQARKSGLFGVIAVTSDSAAILAAAREAGADELIERPRHLATDRSPRIDAVAHCVDAVESRRDMRFATIAEVPPTSPLRTPMDIVGAVELLESRGVSSVVSGCEARRNPYYNILERQEDGTVAISKPGRDLAARQDAPRCFDMNDAIYVWRGDALRTDPRVLYSDTLLYEMPQERSLDIDTPHDFLVAEIAYARQRNGRE
jgi:CMP-N-acetylneuraminic acid synthetase